MLYKELYGSAEMDTQAFVKSSLGLIEKFKINPSYAINVSQNRQFLEDVKNENFAYISHEYFNQNWNCFYFYTSGKNDRRS
ncbi:hypothetical protein IP360_07815 [Helicobacter winghamensis]|uniref:hypothetical protein n=1 Tax=Helicobacter winghamensis TaxID=157268 RepID=UPI00279B4902